MAKNKPRDPSVTKNAPIHQDMRAVLPEGDLAYGIPERLAELLPELGASAPDWLPPDRRQRAIEQADRLRRARPRALDPGGPVPRDGFELLGDDYRAARLRRVPNPRPNSSFGFAGEAVEVSSDGGLRGAMLKVALNPELARGLDPASVRIFRFDEPSGNWLMVAHSGASPLGDYAWARLSRRGVYVPIGLPLDVWLFRTVVAIDAFAPWLSAARKLEVYEGFIEPICKLILCANPFAGARNDPAVAQALGLPMYGGIPGPGDICDRCLGLEVPNLGLPEGQILHDPGIGFEPGAGVLPFRVCKHWESVGPTNISGRIRCLVVHPLDSKVVYAGAASGGVWKTIDGGLTWHPTMALELSMGIGGLDVCESSPDVVYAGTGEGVFLGPPGVPGPAGVGVYKSTDGGRDWDLVSPIKSTRCTRVLVHPSNPLVVYVAGSFGLEKSIDGGASWTTLRAGLCSDAVLDPGPPETIYAAFPNEGVYKSTTGGTSWPLSPLAGLPSGATAGNWIKLAIGRNGASGKGFLLAKMGPNSGLLYQSKNSGVTWTSVVGAPGGSSRHGWTSLVAVDPNSEDVIFVGAEVLSRSTDGGQTWTPITSTGPDHNALVFDLSNSAICTVATGSGVFRSQDNGVTWAARNSGLVTTQLLSMGVAQTGPFVKGSGSYGRGIVRSNGTSSWADSGVAGEGGIFVVDPNDSTIVYVSPWNSSTVFQSTNQGQPPWAAVLTNLAWPPGRAVGLAVKPGDSDIVLCTSGYDLFRSSNRGASWQIVLTTTPPPTGAGSLARIAFSQSKPDVCYVTTFAGRVLRSIDAGVNWSLRSMISPYCGLVGLAVDRTDENLLYVACGGQGLGTISLPRIHRSSDGGATWTDAGGLLPTDALPDVRVNDLLIDQNNPEVVYAATDIGVFRTRDGGDSWAPFDDGMPRIAVSELALARTPNALYASTVGRGAYRWAL